MVSTLIFSQRDRNCCNQLVHGTRVGRELKSHQIAVKSMRGGSKVEVAGGLMALWQVRYDSGDDARDR